MLAVFRPIGIDHDGLSIITKADWNGRAITPELSPAPGATYRKVIDIVSSRDLFAYCGIVRRWPLFKNDFGPVSEECTVSSVVNNGYVLDAVLAAYMLIIVLRQEEPGRIFSSLVTRTAKNCSLRDLNRAEAFFMSNHFLANNAQEEWYRVAYDTILGDRDAPVEGDIAPLDEPIEEQFVAGVNAAFAREVRERAPARADDGEEYDKHYSNTYVKSGKGWVYFDRMYSKDIARVHCLVENDLKQELVKVADIDFTPLKNGIYNTNSSCILVSKDPNRQWRRGVCKETYKINSVVYDILTHIHENILNRKNLSLNTYSEFGWFDWDNESTVLRILNSFEVNKHKPYNEAIESIQKGARLACAVDDKMWMMANVAKQGVVLFYKSTMVAEIDNDSIKIVSPAFNQEVLDFVRNNNCQLRIV